MSLSRLRILLLIAANSLCALAALLVVGVASCEAAQGGGNTYYVSPSGSDSASGRSPDRAWRTVRKASQANVAAGDTVLFRGGQTFSDDALMPEHSGRAGAPIVYGSYGGGRADISQGVWLGNVNDLIFQGLAINGAREGVSGTGNRITVEDSRITNVGIGINNHGSGWLIRRNVVDNTGDSGLILQGSGHRVERNTITDTGRDRSIPYAKHGIYMKASRTRVTRNVIRRFSADGVSARLRDGVVSSNRISGGAIGIAWFQNDSRSGVSRWSGNQIAKVSEAGLYVSKADAAGPTIERFVISGNVVRTSASFMDLNTAPGHTQLSCNTLLQGTGQQQVCSAAAAARLH